MWVRPCNAARKLLADAVRSHHEVASLAQVILSVCPIGIRYTDFITATIGTEWPESVAEAMWMIGRWTPVDVDSTIKGDGDSGLIYVGEARRITLEIQNRAL